MKLEKKIICRKFIKTKCSDGKIHPETDYLRKIYYGDKFDWVWIGDESKICTIVGTNCLRDRVWHQMDEKTLYKHFDILS